MDSKKILSVSFLVIALSVAYYFVYFLPQKENQRIELQKQETLQKRLDAEKIESDKAKMEEEQKTALSDCLSEAEVSYHSNWRSECESQGKLSSTCIKLLDMTLEKYMEENKIPTTDKFIAMSEFYDKRSDCSCRLPLDNSDRIDGWRKEAKDDCYRQFGN